LVQSVLRDLERDGSVKALVAALLLLRTVAGSPAMERPRRPEAPGGFGRAGALPSGLACGTA